MKPKSLSRLLLLALLLAACSKSGASGTPVVASMKQSYTSAETPAVAAVAATPTLPAQPEIPPKPANALVSEVTLNKSAILGRTFNYSASLQFSSIVDKSTGAATSQMAISMGEVPAKFNIMDDKLEFLTDGTINFESDVNHPSRLIYTFPILSQTIDTITIRVDTASPIIDTFLYGNDDPESKVPILYSFLRSMQYVADNELMMIESTVELKDGSIAEFMESFRPREQTVAADVKPVYNDPDLNKDSARYDYLDAGDVYLPKPGKPDVRIKTKVADRWDMRNGQPIKWYVTSNIPDEYLDAVKNGVEGWNRYSRAAGNPDLIQFEGKLPDGIKVGDPRYNLIVWDTVQDAGAAYESQNADPTTGIQSHSMIYIPFAWVNIGKAYWDKFAPETQSPSELESSKTKDFVGSRNFMGRSLPLNCMESPEEHLAIASRDNPEQFANALLRDVVFHEVGHSFGLAHQFKGSLSFDPNDPSKMFSNSIMDYNDYAAEAAAYSGDNTSDGPLLEYDRQIISVIYNGGKDVKASDPNIPACADDVADSTDKGVDPLCIRYDIGADPTQVALQALSTLTDAKAKAGLLPVISAKTVSDSLTGMPASSSIKTEDDLDAAVTKAQALVGGTIGVYLSNSSESFGSLGAAAAKSLKVFQKDVLPEGYDENDMRDRALQSLEASVAMDVLPDLTKSALLAARPALMLYVQSTPYVQGLSREDQQKLTDKLSSTLDSKLYTDVQTSLLSKMRQRFITAIVNTPTAPMGFVKRNGKNIDVELEVMGLLATMASEKTGAVNRPMAERTAALKALKTYNISENFQPIADKVVNELKAEISSSTDALRREDIRTLLANFIKIEDPKKKDSTGT
jgi:hypothetical protein